MNFAEGPAKKTKKAIQKMIENNIAAWSGWEGVEPLPAHLTALAVRRPVRPLGRLTVTATATPPSVGGRNGARLGPPVLGFRAQRSRSGTAPGPRPGPRPPGVQDGGGGRSARRLPPISAGLLVFVRGAGRGVHAPGCANTGFIDNQLGVLAGGAARSGPASVAQVSSRPSRVTVGDPHPGLDECGGHRTCV